MPITNKSIQWILVHNDPRSYQLAGRRGTKPMIFIDNQNPIAACFWPKQITFSWTDHESCVGFFLNGTIFFLFKSLPKRFFGIINGLSIYNVTILCPTMFYTWFYRVSHYKTCQYLET